MVYQRHQVHTVSVDVERWYEGTVMNPAVPEIKCMISFLKGDPSHDTLLS